MPYDLTAQQISAVLKFREGGFSRRVFHFFRPITLADWVAYEAAQNQRIEQHGSQEVQRRDLIGAAEQMWMDCIHHVAGYMIQTNAGAADHPEYKELCDVHADWRERISAQHKVAAILGIQQVTAEADDTAPETDAPRVYVYDSTQMRIPIQAARDGIEYPGLLHVMRRPTGHEMLTFSRIDAASLVVRGTRHPTAIIPSQVTALCRLYDAMVIEVAGYCAGERKITSRDDAKLLMDSVHKKVAIMAAFLQQ
jgi:hypothetical protein